MVDRYEAVERFARLRDEGVISEEEFAAEKAKLLGGAEVVPDVGTMRPATIAAPAPRSRSPLWLGLGALVVVAVVAGLLLATRADQSASPAPAATTATRRQPPACDSPDARTLLAQAVTGSGAALAAVGRIAQTGLDTSGELRTCTADVTLAGRRAQNRTFQLLAPGDGGPVQLSFLDAAAAPASGEPAGNASVGNSAEGGTDEEIAADDVAYYRHQAALAAPKPITVFTDDGLLCCVTLSEVVRYFSTQGGSASLDPSDDGSAVISVKDPAGRWRGLTGFELNFVAAGPDKLGVRLQSLSVNGQALPDVDPIALLRASFDLRPSGATLGGR